ncbi:MAG: hypothetical protein ABI693_09610 [Bryobacteraceae bacterium]
MPSSIEQARNGPHARRIRDIISVWNRKGHYYLGLYFLFFLWLFAFTGLLLNHSWSFAEFWPTRTVTKFVREVRLAGSSGDLERARQVMQQVGIQGEIEWTDAKVDSPALAFRVARPGWTWQVNLNAESTSATVEQTAINNWGVMRVLHTFTGIRAGDLRNDRDWILTTVWALSMDAVAAGLGLMVVSGLYLWIGIPAKRTLGAIVLLLGSLVCAFFVVGLWLVY